MNRILILAVCFFAGLHTDAKTFKALFIGNSYTDVNNLPEMVTQIAVSLGDTLIYQKSTPGGYTLQGHSVYAPTLQLINQGGWDYVVLQEQSQYPSFPLNQVQDEVFPYAKTLDSLIHVASPCAKTVFYMTWGRKNGDPDNCPIWPPVCTYEGMDSLLQLRYTMMAESNNAWISPVGKVWHYIRDNNPTIELYAPDGSHPSLSGTYLAGLSFYTVLFGKDPSQTTFTSGINPNDANIIKQATKFIAYDSLTKWRRFNPPLKALYTYTSSGNNFNFQSNSEGTVTAYNWNFGDGTASSNLVNPSHTFTSAGNYQVCLTVRDSCNEDTFCQTIQIGSAVGIEGVDEYALLQLYPNPAKDILQFKNFKTAFHYTIFNSIGSKVKTGIVDIKNPTVNVSVFPAGIYYLELKNKEYVSSIKWLKN